MTKTTTPELGTLRPDYGNHYYRVRSAFSVFALTGKYEGTNCYYGSSQIQQAVVEPLRLNVGDQVHALVGGDFAVLKDGTVREIRMTRPSSDGIFCKSYGDGVDRSWPLRRLTEIAAPKMSIRYRG